MGRIEIDEQRCKGCLLCTVACPHKLIQVGERLNSNGYRPVAFDEGRRDECTGCTQCARMCPDIAISVYR